MRHFLQERDLEAWTQTWVAVLPSLEPIPCPRCLIPDDGYEVIYLGVLGNASAQAYAAEAYVVCDYIPGPLYLRNCSVQGSCHPKTKEDHDAAPGVEGRCVS